MKLLATADIHMGRRACQVPDSALEYASCAGVWKRVVEYAIDQKVDAVLLAGDMVDENNKFYEAIGPFEEGIKELENEGIPILAVSGNHDHDVLPGIVDAFGGKHVHLLGRDGTWERKIIVSRDGREKLQVFGWSFPGREVHYSPLHAFPRSEVDASFPAIGLLHADLDKGEKYCPVDRSEFSTTMLPLWVLGHIHKPSEINTDDSPILLYPGSPQGMDPGETGIHGVLLIEVRGQEIHPQPRPLARIVYENLELKIDGVLENYLQAYIAKFLKQEFLELNKHGELKVLSARLHIQGRSKIGKSQIEEQCNGLIETGLYFEKEHVWINRLSVSVQPEIDLEDRSRFNSFDGCLARLILALQEGKLNREQQALVDRIKREASYIYGSPVFSMLDDSGENPDDSLCRNFIIQQAWLLLDILDRQRTVGVGQ
jgi:exonuclease SbcD